MASWCFCCFVELRLVFSWRSGVSWRFLGVLVFSWRFLVVCFSWRFGVLAFSWCFLDVFLVFSWCFLGVFLVFYGVSVFSWCFISVFLAFWRFLGVLAFSRRFGVCMVSNFPANCRITYTCAE